MTIDPIIVAIMVICAACCLGGVIWLLLEKRKRQAELEGTQNEISKLKTQLEDAKAEAQNKIDELDLDG